MDDVTRVAERADALLDLANAHLGDAFFYQSLPLCALDAVFSIGVRWQGVRNVVARYCAAAGIPEFRPHGSDFPTPAEQESMTSFCARLRSWGTDDDIAARLGSRQRTSTHPTSSILKAEATLRFADQLRAFKVEYFQDLAALTAERERSLEQAIRTIPGQGSGISWAAFRLCAGDDNQVKPDRMVRRFLHAVLGRNVEPTEAIELVREAARLLSGRHPGLSARLLDTRIWDYQSRNPNV